MNKNHDRNINKNVKITITSNNVELRDLTSKLIFMKILSGVNSISSASLDFAIPYTSHDDLKRVYDLSRCELGNDFIINVDEGKGSSLLFVGVLISKDLNLENNYAYISLTLKHQLIKLDQAVRSQVFKNKKNSEIAQSLCTWSGIRVDNEVTDDHPNEQLIQFRCSDWQIFRYCLGVNGSWFIPEPGHIRIIKPKLNHPGPVIDAKDGHLIEKGRWQFSIIDQPPKLTLSAWDIQKSEAVSVVAKSTNMVDGRLAEHNNSSLSKVGWDISLGIWPSYSSLNRCTDALLQNIRQSSINCEFKAVGSTKYKLGETLTLTGFGHDFDGSGIITAVNHTFTPSKWTTIVTIGEPVHTLSNNFSLPGVNGLQPAIVDSYAEVDPQGLFRINVNLPILNSHNNKNQIWARFAMPYASKEASFICYPEPGDEVILSFYDDNPCYPVIVGSLHNPQRTPVIKPGDGHGMKGWKSASSELGFDPNQETINMSVPNAFIQIKESGVEAASEMDVKIKSKKQISIDGEDSVTINSRLIDLKK
ncbi:phage baseplate assembly protein V [Aeromonas sp. SG16]|uniref:phage baseplate assembly protein V n=1 Tax=Aeromonas sp. SG16 TaxID=2950548 RepID=UPI00210CC21D|nr:phage baseplate assembly protein V [Aeromonas sp. SG16]MCQ4054442.1 phage baseplate assembly protein V [Aeromonas sp. SG16]